MREPYAFRQGFEDKGSSFLLWLRHRVLSIAISAASFSTVVSLIAPAWLDFLLDLSMVGLVALVGKLAKRK